MAKYYYNKYNATAATIWTWRQYNLSSKSSYKINTSPVNTSFSEGCTSYTFDSNTGIFTLVGTYYDSYSSVSTGTTLYHISGGGWRARTGKVMAGGPKESGGDGWNDGTKYTAVLSSTTIRGTYRGTVTSTSSTTYPTNGKSGSYWYDTRTSSTVYSQGSYIGQVTAEDGTYPNDGRHTDGYWYVRGTLANTAPLIDGYSGSTSIDLGTKTSNFNVEYTVTDAEGGVVKVDIYEDSTKVVTDKTISLGYKNSYTVDLSKFSLGSHNVKVVAKDSDGATSERTYSFYKSNTAPVISGEDKDLGDKNTSFTQEFTVTDADFDQVSVLVTLNGEEINNIANAIGQAHIINITQEMLAKLPLGEVNHLVIKADDGKTGVTYRRYTFTRVNKAPIISGENRDIGEVNKVSEINGSFTATDLEGDEITAKLYLNNKEIIDFGVITDNEVNNYEIEHMDFITLGKGEHTLKIVATDDKGASSERIITFTKKALKLEMIIEVNETDVAAKKILAILNMIKAEEDILSVKACNNYKDETPTWEDITSKSVAKMVHQYENIAKTAEVWKIALWITITKASPEEQRSVIRGVSGGYE